MSEIVIREANEQELGQLSALATEALPPDVVARGGGLETLHTTRALASDVVFVAAAEHHVAGYVAVSEPGDLLVVDQLVISATDEGRGVGNLLLDWIEGYGVSRRRRAVRITVEPANRPARKFYARRGYLDAGETAVERELVHT